MLTHDISILMALAIPYLLVLIGVTLVVLKVCDKGAK